MVRAALSLASAVTIAVLSGCLGYEFIGPEESRPFAGIEATFGHADSLDILVLISIDAGTDESGRRRRLDQEVVIVAGRTVEPVRAPEPGRYEFEILMRSGPGSEPATIVVTLPGIAGEAAPLDVVVPVVRRAGPRDVVWNAADQLILPIHAPSVDEPVFARWQIDFAVAGAPAGRLSFVGAFGWPPDSVIVPRSLVPDADGTIEAVLDVRAGLSPDPGSPWNVGTSLRAAAVWTVHEPS